MRKRTPLLLVLFAVIAVALVTATMQPDKVNAKARGDATVTPEPSLTPTLTMPAELPVITVGNIAKVTELTTLHTKEPWIMDVAFSPDSSLLATLDAGGIVVLWRAKTATKLVELDPENDFGLSNGDVEFSPDGALLASSNGFNIYLWDVKSALTQAHPTPKWRLQGHKLVVAGLKFSPNGALLASCDVEDFAHFENSTRSTIRLWETATGKQLSIIRTYSSGACCLVFTPDGTNFLVTIDDGTLRTWSIKEQRQIASSPGGGKFSPDGKLIAVMGEQHEMVSTIQVKEFRTGKILFTFETHAAAAFFSSDGSMLVSGDPTEGSRGIDVWDAKTGKKVTNLGFAGAVTSIVFSPDMRLIAVGEDGAGGAIAYAHIWGIRQ